MAFRVNTPASPVGDCKVANRLSTRLGEKVAGCYRAAVTRAWASARLISRNGPNSKSGAAARCAVTVSALERGAGHHRSLQGVRRICPLKVASQAFRGRHPSTQRPAASCCGWPGCGGQGRPSTNGMPVAAATRAPTLDLPHPAPP